MIPSWYPSDDGDPAGSFFREQALSLAGQGAQVGVLAASLIPLSRSSLRQSRNTDIQRQDDNGVNTLRISRLNVTPRMPRAASIRHANMVDQLFSSYVADFGKPDIVHVHAALPAGQAAQRLQKREGIPYVYSEHSSAFARGLVGRSGVAAVRACALNASASYAVSQPFAQLLDGYLELSPGFFGVMPNSVDDSFLNAEIKGPTPGVTRFVHISNLHDKKNVDGLLRSFAQAYRGDSAFQLVIGGDGPNSASLQELAVDLGLAGQVEFVGVLQRQAVPGLLADSDVFVLPSKVEPFGVVVIEALAMGLPVVATRSGGPEGIVGPGDGYLVALGDEAELTTALLACASPDDTPTRLERRERCRARFAGDTVASEWLEIYAQYVR